MGRSYMVPKSFFFYAHFNIAYFIWWYLFLLLCYLFIFIHSFICPLFYSRYRTTIPIKKGMLFCFFFFFFFLMNILQAIKILCYRIFWFLNIFSWNSVFLVKFCCCCVEISCTGHPKYVYVSYFLSTYWFTRNTRNDCFARWSNQCSVSRIFGWPRYIFAQFDDVRKSNPGDGIRKFF